MVQYKTMEKKEEEKEFGYRPIDTYYQSEIARMQMFHDLFQDVVQSEKASNESLSHHNYRLNPDIFYFKICDALMFERSPDLIDGLYFPLEFWEKLLQSDEGKGKLGGLKIMRSQVKRYFSNSLFIELVQKGWIGSRLQISDALNLVLKASLNSIGLNRLVLWAKGRKLTSDEKASVRGRNSSASLSRSIFSN